MSKRKKHCYRCSAVEPENYHFLYCPFTYKDICISCLIQLIRDLKTYTFPNPMILAFNPKRSKLRKIFEHSKTARNLWMLYRSTHLYGDPVARYLESDQFLKDCERFNNNFSYSYGCIEELKKIFCQLHIEKIEWWLAARPFLGPDNRYWSGRQELKYEVKISKPQTV